LLQSGPIANRCAVPLLMLSRIASSSHWPIVLRLPASIWASYSTSGSVSTQRFGFLPVLGRSRFHLLQYKKHQKSRRILTFRGMASRIGGLIRMVSRIQPRTVGGW